MIGKQSPTSLQPQPCKVPEALGPGVFLCGTGGQKSSESSKTELMALIWGMLRYPMAAVGEVGVRLVPLMPVCMADWPAGLLPLAHQHPCDRSRTSSPECSQQLQKPVSARGGGELRDT